MQNSFLKLTDKIQSQLVFLYFSSQINLSILGHYLRDIMTQTIPFAFGCWIKFLEISRIVFLFEFQGTRMQSIYCHTKIIPCSWSDTFLTCIFDFKMSQRNDKKGRQNELQKDLQYRRWALKFLPIVDLIAKTKNMIRCL